MKIIFNISLLSFFLLYTAIANTQVYSNKVVGKKNEPLIDSIKTEASHCSIPVWGAEDEDEEYGDEESAAIQYSLNQRPKDLWNFIIGSQYQINKHIMLRAEYGFLGSRTQFMAGLQYRFGL